MKIGRWAGVFLAVVPLLSGCSGFWNPPASTSTGTGTGSGAGAFYVLNEKTSQVAAFTISSGTVTAISGSPYALSSVPLAMAISPSGNLLYVSTAAGIYVYTVASGGALTLGNGNAVISSDPATTMAVDPSGAWLIESISGEGTLNAIPLDTSTGLVISGGAEETVALPVVTVNQLAISPATTGTTQYVFVAMGSGGTAVVPYTPTNTNPFGSVATIAAKNSAGGATAVGVDPSNRLLYVGETAALSGTQTGGLRVFTIGATSLTEISGSPYQTAGTGPSSILATADYVYVANRAVSGSTTGNITGFAITATGSVYSLTSVNTVATGIGTVGLAEDSTSTYVLAVNSGGSPDLNTFTFDTTTLGKLDAGTTAATGSDPVEALAVTAVP
jgi:6-phosphogluconolactonase (cycloisomerase 2 family)